MERDTDVIASLRNETYQHWSSYKPDVATLLIVVFSPGFSSDLTHWQIRIGTNGQLDQRILWNNFDRPNDRKGVEERHSQVSTAILETIQQKILELDLSSIDRLLLQATIDDAAQVGFQIPSRKLTLSDTIPLFYFEYLAKRNQIPNDALKGYQGLSDLWNTIDQASPYSRREHWK